MNLYLVSRTEQVDYDETQAVVVSASSEEDALNVFDWGWVRRDELNIELIGKSIVPRGLVIEDFNAG